MDGHAAGRNADEALEALCVRTLGEAPEQHETFTTGPAGAVRGTRRLRVGRRTVYATRRRDPAVATKEATVLRELDAGGAPVPGCLAFEAGWLLQASAGEERMSESLNATTPEAARDLLRRALESLAAIQEAGRKAALAAVVTPFAAGADTAASLLGHLHAIAGQAGVPLPGLDEARLAEHLGASGPTFIKWDARPANAALGGDGVVRWFDWQHANCRHAADDLVWLLCDESIPDHVGAADILLDHAEAWGATAERVCAVGAAHVGVRLHGILLSADRLEIPWAASLAHDWLGSREAARRLCRRGAAVAGRASLTKPLAAWFAEIGAGLGGG